MGSLEQEFSLGFLAVTFASLFSTVNPLGATPFFLAHPSIAGSLSEQKRAAKRASLSVFLILTIFAMIGEVLFRLIGISIVAFQIAGGIFIFTVALEMMRGKHVRAKTLPEEQTAALEQEDISIIPLATPLLAGPGSITMVIVLMSKVKAFYQAALLVLIIAMVAFCAFLILRYSPILLRFLNQSGVRIMNRVMGLIIGAIAVQFWIDGLSKLAPMFR